MLRSPSEAIEYAGERVGILIVIAVVTLLWAVAVWWRGHEDQKEERRKGG